MQQDCLLVVQNVAAEELGSWWPATGGAWVLAGKWVQGGVRGWFRSMQFPAGGRVEARKLVPVGIASL